ncbi:MAG: phosphoribosyltransferase [Synechococcus sp. TMED20]|jgi:hypoxanthine phosphoribosyltransferase|nr:MAG: phosphoribosyltransferase [Synechococcus sp. TMED20]
MRELTWQQFDLAVSALAERFQDRSIPGIYGVPRGGLCLAVALSHALELPLLMAPESRCLIVDEVFETGQTLAALRQQWPDAAFAVWVSKISPAWWEAVDVTNSQEWLVFPWENLQRARADERLFRASRGLD